MGGGRGDRMVLVDAAENPGRLGYQLCGPWPSILSYRAVLRAWAEPEHFLEIVSNAPTAEWFVLLLRRGLAAAHGPRRSLTGRSSARRATRRSRWR